MTSLIIAPPNVPRIDAYKVAVKYATDVLNGAIVAGKLVRLAAKRFISDLKVGPARGITMSKERAQHVIDFFGTLRQWKGEWGLGKGSPFILSPWQVFILVNMFGFIRADGTRRFRSAHIEVARKNGKTTLLAGVGLYMLYADDEPGAEVYCIATKKDQAREVFDCAVQLRSKTPYLAKGISISGGKVAPSNMHVLSTASKFQLQASDYGSADGKNVHCVIADELHQHTTRYLYDAYNQATGARRQSLVIGITTAGYNKDSICWDNRVVAENILCGNVTVTVGDHVFAYIACIDEPDTEGKGGDDWNNEACWIKANPNLGISPKLDNLREEYGLATISASALNGFLCKRLNVWTSQDIRWMPVEKWARCNAAGPLASPIVLRQSAIECLKNRTCVGGLDLSENTDLSAFVLVFPPAKAVVESIPRPQTRQEIFSRTPVVFDEKIITPADPQWSVLAWFWVPEECIAERVKKDRVRYDVWQREGYLSTCPGNTIKHEFIHKQILELKNKFNFINIAYDDWHAQWIGEKLKDEGFAMEKIRPVFQTFSEPMKQLMGMVLEKKLEHYGDPILSWNAGNVSALINSNGDIRPDKEKSKEKIDGIVAMIMALSLICAQPTLAQANSVYSERGIIFL